MYVRVTMVEWEMERFRMSVIQVDNLRSLLGIMRIDRIQNTWIRELKND